MSEKQQYTVFYSWQSDLPSASNHRFIHHRLTEACNEVESKQNDFIFNVDEATRGAAGSPNIPTTIMEKIRLSDIFVCDISTINSHELTTKKTPNPNVVFELGYAVATLGWNRIVLLFNTEYGKFPDDLPFDFDRHRAAKYVATAEPTKQHKSDLKVLLIEAIGGIFSANPIKTNECLSPEQTKRSRDSIQVTNLLSTLHLPTLEDHIEQLPRVISDNIFFHWEDFKGIIENYLFHIYDPVLLKSLKRFHKHFQATLQYGFNYHPVGNRSIFSNPMDAPLDEAQEESWQAIAKSAGLMKKELNKILVYVRENFVEIDISETNKIAWQRRIDFNKRDS